MAWGGCGSPFIEMEISEQNGKVSEIPKREWIAKRWVGGNYYYALGIVLPVRGCS